MTNIQSSDDRMETHYIHRMHYTARERLVGAFILGAMALLLVLLLVKSEGSRLFQEQIPYRALLNNAQGISNATEVRISGVAVGRVTSLDISSDNRIEVRFFVYERFSELLRADSVATLGKPSLFGSSLIDIAAGSPSEPMLPAGATIQVIEPKSLQELITELEPIAADLRSIISHTNELMMAVEADEVRTITGNLIQVSRKLDQMTAQITSGKGAAGALLFSETMGKSVNNTLASLQRAAGALNESSEKLPEILAKVDTVLAQAEVTGARLPPLAGKTMDLVTDVRQTNRQLQKSLDQLHPLMSQTNRLIQNSNEVTEGVKRIWPLSKALEHKEPELLPQARPVHE